jgi:parallel beta-helix repeat protein
MARSPSRAFGRPVHGRTTPGRRLVLQWLEDRLAPATFTVTNTGDAGAGNGSSGDLRYCITQANSVTGASTIDASGVTGTITLNSALPTITDPVTISGPGAGVLTVTRAVGGFPIFTAGAASGQSVTIVGLDIDGNNTGSDYANWGIGQTGGDLSLIGVIVRAAAVGVGNTGPGKTTVLGCTVRDNAGAGIYDTYAGTLVVDRSTVAGNGGSGISSSLNLTVSNSTIAGNSAATGGGGISLSGYTGTVNLAGDTITDNRSGGPAPIPGLGGGGGIGLSAYVNYQPEHVAINLDSCIVAGNLSANGSNDISVSPAPGPSTVESAVVSAKYCAFGRTDGFTLTDLGHNLVGASLLLAPVQDNGGSNPTVALLAGSAAIDAGDPALVGIADERGIVRPVGGGIDIGAYERAPNTIGGCATVSDVYATTAPAVYQFTVTYADDVPINVGQVSSSNLIITSPSGVTPPAVSVAGLDASDAKRLVVTYQFTAPGGAWSAADNGNYTVNMVPLQVADANGFVAGGPLASFRVTEPVIFTVTDSSDATGPGTLRSAITAANAIAPAPALIVFGNSSAGGSTNFYDGAPHTISLSSTLPTIINSISIVGPGSTLLTISPVSGGAFQLLPINPSRNAPGTTAVNLTGLTFTGAHSAAAGAAISDNYAVLTLTDVAVTNNRSDSTGGGIGFGYGAVALELINCTIQGNTSAKSGGGIGFQYGGDLSVTGSTISANSAAGQGGGVSMLSGYLEVSRSTVAGNSSGGNGGGIAVGLPIVGQFGRYFAQAFSTDLLIDRSTLTGNSAGGPGVGGGGLYLAGAVNGGGATISNSTIANNTAVNGGGVAAATLLGKLAITGSTITGNTAVSVDRSTSGRGGGGVALYSGYGTYAGAYSTIALDSSIVSGNSATNGNQDIAQTIAGPPTKVAAAYSAVGTTTGYTLTDLGGNLSPAHSMPAALQLGVLTDNGGPTQTISIGAAGTGRDHGDPALAGTTDQRGVFRPQGAGVDIGAFERTPGVPSATGGTHSVISPAEPATYQFTVTYNDDAAIRYSSVDGNNAAVTVTPPAGVPAVNVAFVGASPAGDAATITATYQFGVPGGAWSAGDNGVWTVDLAANQVVDTNGVPVPAGPNGNFQVIIPQTMTVTNTNDAGPGSLRQAILVADSDAPAVDAIVFAPGLAGTIGLTSGPLTLATSMTITGPVGNGIVLNGNNTGSVIVIAGSNRAVTLKNLEITGGSTAGTGGGVYVGANTVTFDGDWIHDNRAASGGGIGGTTFSSITVKNSAVTGNSATINSGGVYASIDGGPTTIVVSNSTLAANVGGAIGLAGPDEDGAIAIDVGTVSVRNSTITGNDGAIGAATRYGTLNVDTVSSIISGNGGDFGYLTTLTAKDSALGHKPVYGSYQDLGQNLPIGAALYVGPLGNYGGPTPICPLTAVSPAIDAGSNPDGLACDQRGPGFPRESPVGLPDIGAAEMVLGGTPITVTTAADSGPGSLRDAITQANAVTGPNSFDAIVLSSSTAGGAVDFYDGGSHTISLLSPLPQLTHAMTITGPGSGLLTVRRDPSAATAFGIFDANASINLAGLAVSGGNAPSGGGISVEARLRLADVTVTNNTATNNGGSGISLTGTASVTLVNSTVSGNSGGIAGVYANGTDAISAVNSTISGNTGVGIAILSQPSTTGSLALTNCTVANNTSRGIYAIFSTTVQLTGCSIVGNTGSGGITLYDDDLLDGSSVSNCTIANNSAAVGAGLNLHFCTGTLRVTGTTVAGNTTSGDVIEVWPGNKVVLALDNTIVSGNHLAGGAFDILAYNGATVTSKYSAIGSTAGFTYVPGPGDLPVGADLKLQPVGVHGGPTPTLAFGAGSPLLNAGDPSLAGTTDQRGVSRAVGPAPDIGAYEYQPIAVAKVQVNDGSAERSEVLSITVTFSGPVSFVNGNAAAAFQLIHVQTGASVALSAATTVDAQGRTVVTLGFSGPATDPVSALNGGAPSLADGRYQLTILGAAVSDAALGWDFDGDGDGVPGGNYVSPADTYHGTGLYLYRLFGDASGDGVVDATDLGQFRNTFNANQSQVNYLAYLDSDNSGAVDAADLGQFRSRFNANVF